MPRLAGGGLPRLKNFLLFFLVFFGSNFAECFFLPRVDSALGKGFASARQKTLGKELFAI
jgi:hypothetical protein